MANPRPRIVDVREPSEFTGPLGHIPGAELVPLATVERAARDWAKDEALCVPLGRSLGEGSRDARAPRLSNGFNLEGGTQGMRALFPIER